MDFEKISHPYWEEMQLTFHVDRDLSVFKTWPEVRHIPLYVDNQYVKAYYDEIMHIMPTNPDKKYWQHILKQGEPFLGHTKESYKKSQNKLSPEVTTTGMRLKSIHHIVTFEYLIKRSILSYDHIVEFGAGIGDVAHLIYDRGYTGKYTIIDFPEVGRLSSYYLSNRNEFITNINDLQLTTSNTLFIATWSLSETPIPYRLEVAKKIKGLDFLIVAQTDFYGINNRDFFFGEWPFYTNTFFRIRPIIFHEYNKGSWYMVGTSPQ